MQTAPYVELRSVSKYFGSVIALKDVSFDVCPARFIACWATTAPASRR